MLQAQAPCGLLSSAVLQICITSTFVTAAPAPTPDTHCMEMAIESNKLKLVICCFLDQANSSQFCTEDILDIAKKEQAIYILDVCQRHSHRSCPV